MLPWRGDPFGKTLGRTSRAVREYCLLWPIPKGQRTSRALWPSSTASSASTFEDYASTNWTFSFQNIRDMSDTNHLTIDGNVGDTINLDNFAQNSLSGGEWMRA